jgi:hypothetical protein
LPPWPSPDEFDYSLLSEQRERYQDYALLNGFADIWQRPGLVRGWEKGTTEEVRRKFTRYCLVLGRQGGSILAPGHLFQPEVPPENILAFYDPALR